MIIMLLRPLKNCFLSGRPDLNRRPRRPPR